MADNPIPLLPPAMPKWPSDDTSQHTYTEAESQALQEELRLMQHPLHAHLMAQEITPDKVIPKREFLFQLFGKPCYAKGELVAVTGKAKSGKTFLCSSLITAALKGECMGFRRQAGTAQRVLWIDTEQSEESTQEILVARIMAQVCDTLFPEEGVGSKPRVYNLRSVTWDQRMQYIEAAIQVHQPDLVIFDGIRDVVADINDGVRAQQVVERMMQLASMSNACIVCVLHQNKAAEDSTLRGALGTELMNKCFETYECKKQQGDFSVEQTATRKYDIHDVLHFTVAANGLPMLQTVMPETTQSANSADNRRQSPNPYVFYQDGRSRANCVRLLQETFAGRDALTRPEIVNQFVCRLGAGTQNWADKLVEGIIQHGTLRATTDAAGIVRYSY